VKKTKQQGLHPIDGYIEEISALLPYTQKRKAPILKELKKDVQDAMGPEKRPPSVVFGSPVDVARNVSIAQDWGIKTAGWGIRTFAYIIDFIVLLVVVLLFNLIWLILLNPEFDEIALHTTRYYFGFIFLGIPLIGLILCYFMFFEAIYSTTLGKRLLGLFVVDESGIKINWMQTFIRNVTKVPFLTSFLLFDILLGIISEKTKGRKQRVLDFVAGTKVVQIKKLQ